MTLGSSVVDMARLRAAFGAMMFAGALGAATGAAHAQITVDRLQIVTERWGGWENLGGLSA